MARVNGKLLKPTRWGMILSAFGRQQKGIIFTPDEERLARLRNLPKEIPKKADPPKESRWFSWLWGQA